VAVDGDLHGGAALTGKLVGARGEAVGRDVLALQQPGVAGGEPVPVDGRQQSVPEDGLERFRPARR
jgi:hypothetical protein